MPGSFNFYFSKLRHDGTALELFFALTNSSTLKFKSMKTISTLFIFLFLSLSVFAMGRNSGSLIVQSNGRGDLKVTVDGKQFTTGDNFVMINDVRAGLHKVKVMRQVNTGLFSKMIKKFDVVYDGKLMIKSNTQVSLTIDRFGRVNVTEQAKWANGRYGDFDYKKGQGSDFRNRTQYGYNDRLYSQVMRNQDFEFVLQSIRKEWFETNMMESARHIISTNYFTAEQVRRLIQVFNMENNRLELAKLAFTKTVDQYNYQQVIEQLMFTTSKAELSWYIQNHR